MGLLSVMFASTTMFEGLEGQLLCVLRAWPNCPQLLHLGWFTVTVTGATLLLMHTGITTALLVHIIYFDFDYAHHGSITMEESWIIRFTLLPRSQPFWIGKAITMAGARVSRLMASRANSSWHSLNGRLINKDDLYNLYIFYAYMI